MPRIISELPAYIGNSCRKSTAYALIGNMQCLMIQEILKFLWNNW